MQTDILKKESPKAARKTAGVILEKSGRNKKFTPAAAPERVRARRSHTKRRRNRTGRTVLATRSMPFWTPAMITVPTTASTAHCQTKGAMGLTVSVTQPSLGRSTAQAHGGFEDIAQPNRPLWVKNLTTAEFRLHRLGTTKCRGQLLERAYSVRTGTSADDKLGYITGRPAMNKQRR